MEALSNVNVNAATTPNTLEHQPIGNGHYVGVYQSEYVGLREFAANGRDKIYPTRNGTRMSRIQWTRLMAEMSVITMALAMMETRTLQLDETFSVEVVPGAMLVFRRSNRNPYAISAEQWEALTKWNNVITDMLYSTPPDSGLDTL